VAGKATSRWCDSRRSIFAPSAGAAGVRHAGPSKHQCVRCLTIFALDACENSRRPAEKSIIAATASRQATEYLPRGKARAFWGGPLPIVGPAAVDPTDRIFEIGVTSCPGRRRRSWAMSARMIANARQRLFFDFYCPDRKDKQPLTGLGTHGAPRPAAIPARWPLSGSPQPSAACCTHLVSRPQAQGASG